MTDRAIVYTAAITQSTDVLNVSKFAMLGDAFMALATLGNSATSPSTVVAGLPCTPTSPASLQVNVGPGAIFAIDATDATGYGDLGTDATQIFKMGIRPSTSALTITPPSTAGFSQVFLVQAILSDVDGGDTVLSYFNAANPSIPFSGPNNSGTSQKTTRTCVCTVALKAGVAATTGTQATPAPDPGFTALYAITVANGQTQITSPNIVQANAGFAPFVNTALPYVPAGVQAGSWTYGNQTVSSAGAFAAALAPVPASLTMGMRIMLKMNAGPSPGANTLNINALGASSISRRDALTLLGNEWVAGNFVGFVWTGTSWQIDGYIGNLQPLTTNTTFFVNASTGNDSTGDGSSGKPWATLQHAYNAVQQGYNLFGGVTITFNCTGTFTAGLFSSLPITGATGPSAVVFNFTAGSSVTVTNGNCFYANTAPVAFTVQAASGTVTLSASGTGGNGYAIVGNAGGLIYLGPGIAFGTCGQAHINGAAFGQVNSNQNAYSIIGSAPNHVSTSGGNVVLANSTVTGSTGLSFTGGFVSASVLAQCQMYAMTFSGFSGVTGPRFSIASNSVVNTGGGGVNYFPGNSAGSQTTGAQYI